MRQFIKMCFDPNSPMNDKLKQTLLGMLGECKDGYSRYISRCSVAKIVKPGAGKTITKQTRSRCSKAKVDYLNPSTNRELNP